MPRSALNKAREAPSSTKARILTAAEEVFAAKGFEGASTREIAAAAGVNISSLHYHWESKETLYFAVFENIYDRIVDLLHSATPQPSSRAARSWTIPWACCSISRRPSNISKLIMRRLQTTEGRATSSATFCYRRGGGSRPDVRSEQGRPDRYRSSRRYSVLLLFMLDSQRSPACSAAACAAALRARLRS